MFCNKLFNISPIEGNQPIKLILQYKAHVKELTGDDLDTWYRWIKDINIDAQMHGLNAPKFNWDTNPGIYIPNNEDGLIIQYPKYNKQLMGDDVSKWYSWINDITVESAIHGIPSPKVNWKIKLR